ncbi:MAG: hypothetical protein EPN19_11875 [Betaproteobacteria bacterium]|nr:MAG: hypothetical protein EPN19_11875 [Betaproteobacteria bacterium]
MRLAGNLAGLAAILTLVVVAASAAIRLGANELGGAMVIARGVHRAAASLAALLVLGSFWRALRIDALRRPASAAFVLMLALSVVGWATGIQPPPAAALFNQLGGIALAALLAWIAGRAVRRNGGPPADRALAHVALVFAALQIVFGAALVLPGNALAPVLLMAHAVSGLAAAAIGAALGAARGAVRLLVCAALTLLAGILSVLAAPALLIQVGHAAAAALLICALAHAHASMSASA